MLTSSATATLAAIDINDSIWWLISRATGIVAWTLLSMAVCWGLLISTKAAAKASVPSALLGYHRFLGAMAVSFTLVHMLALVADPHVYFGWYELFVPGMALWHPDRLVWGVFAFYLLVAVEGTSLLMRRLPRKLWRQVHRSTFVLYGLATYHGVVSGPDDDNPWLRLVMLASVSVVAFLTVLRILAHHRANVASSGAGTRPAANP